MSRSARGFFVLTAVSLTAGFLAVGQVGTSPLGTDPGGPRGTEREVTRPGDVARDTASGAPVVETVGGSQQAQSRFECAAGRNGGSTAPGVSASSIRVASTVVQDGPAASLLSPAIVGMKTVVDKVNRSGGICGRFIDLTVVNDGFKAQTGQNYIRNFAAGDYFALTVVPSAEGLSAAINTGDISRAGIPVVGTDGMRIEQYQEPWVWPVGTATVSTMRIMADYGYRVRKARTFAIIWDSRYQFGVEGRDAFKDYVEDLSGTVIADFGLDPNSPSYATEVADFNRICGDRKCDMVAMLLLPDAATKWMSRTPERARLYTAGAQTLFTNQFAQACVRDAGSLCDGLSIWTGYNPPIGSLAGNKKIQRYEQDVQAVSPGIDTLNQFLQGAYIGMSLFVEAVREAGPDLTRERLRAVLDSTAFESGLASVLRWRPGNHSANIWAKTFSIAVSQGSFAGWRDERTGWVADPLGGI